jgi:capsular polysaccharide export protein
MKTRMTRSFSNRRFLFLQGPHGPFFGQLGRLLTDAGAEVWRAGFNAGDQAFWPDRRTFLPCHAAPPDWPATIRALLAEKRVTDLVLYGDTRAIHAEAILAAHATGVTVHVFEEGYMRPWWITYERGGSNGHSRLMALPMATISAAMHPDTEAPPQPAAHWGDLRQHVFWGAAYHGLLLAGRRRFPAFQPHRGVTAGQEFLLHLRRFLMLPVHRWERMIATRKIRRGGFPFHLALLQLEHDASFRAHSAYPRMTDFLAEVITAFATSAPAHHHLVFKAHPLEDGRTPLARDIRRLARAAGIAARVHFVRGGKLAALLDQAVSAVTVNSTAGQQALWRGLPLKIMGTAVYGKPGLVSDQPLAEFFASPARPDLRACRDFRRFLLATSQVPGSYYSARGRQAALRRIADMILRPDDPYAKILPQGAVLGQQLLLLT